MKMRAHVLGLGLPGKSRVKGQGFIKFRYHYKRSEDPEL